ncbi:MAG: heat-inducible transcriptional repressor HrcA [Actinomycetota bacterium]|nr:heat-inducible transcriptional repressor HrcA [Actinomycetota bacterium]
MQLSRRQTATLSPRQAEVLRRVVEGHVELRAPVGSKWLAAQPDLPWGPSTIRAELARLEELGLLQHPHTSAGRVPTDLGYRQYVDRLLEDGDLPVRRPALELGVMRREVDEAMRATSEQVSQVTDLLAVVSAPPIETTTIRHVEVLLLQPQVVMVVVITSTGGVTKRVSTHDRTVDPGLVDWAASYLNETLGGMGLGARMLHAKLEDPELSAVEREFLATLAPAFTELEDTAEHTLYVEGTGRLLSEDRVQELEQINDILALLERRVVLLSVLRSALEEPRVYLRIGRENEAPELRSVSLVAANYGTAGRNLGAVSVLGPVRMDYALAIAAVRAAAAELSRFVGDLYER